MKTWRRRVCVLIILACLPGILISAGRLPLQNKALVAKKYAGWSGVLRIWCFEGWTGGEKMSAWIGRCAREFEKKHPGVYVEVQYVGEQAVRDRMRDGVRGPDMILFPPGLIDHPAGLVQLPVLPVRGSLLGCGQGFACPVALGGYAWAVNPGAEEILIPADEPWRSFSRAASALGDPGQAREIEIEPPGVDLGLPVLSQFIRGEAGAMCVTQREIPRLESRMSGWTLSPGSKVWTDQALYLAIPEDGQTELAQALMLHLLEDECQSLLRSVNLFPVTAAPTGYPAGSAMAAMDGMLRREDMETVPAFHLEITE